VRVPHSEKYFAWVVDDDRRGRLLGVELVFFGDSGEPLIAGAAIVVPLH
jgi:hypothetical protein